MSRDINGRLCAHNCYWKKNFGIIHVGWRGAFSDIIKNTVKTFISIGETNDDLNFFIGPHIQKKNRLR